MKRKLDYSDIVPIKFISKSLCTRRFFADANQNTKETCSALSSIMIAAQKGNLEIVKFHIENSNKNYHKEIFGPLRRNLLHLSVLSGNLELINYLIKNKITDIFATDELLNTPLDLASGEGRLIVKREMN